MPEMNGTVASYDLSMSHEAHTKSQHGFENSADYVQQLQSIVTETTRAVRSRIIVEVDSVEDDTFFDAVTLETFLEHISTERLVSMPHEGSHWDKTLKGAEFFALQLNAYAEKLDEFVSGTQNGVKTALASCLLLLDVSLVYCHPLDLCSRL